jgi:hypothetical protein
LFFAQLNPIANRLGAMVAAMLSRGEIALFNCTGIPEAAVSLQEELCSFPPAKPTFRFAVSSQFFSPLIFHQFQNYELRMKNYELKQTLQSVSQFPIYQNLCLDPGE